MEPWGTPVLKRPVEEPSKVHMARRAEGRPEKTNH